MKIYNVLQFPSTSFHIMKSLYNNFIINVARFSKLKSTRIHLEDENESCTRIESCTRDESWVCGFLSNICP